MRGWWNGRQKSAHYHFRTQHRPILNSLAQAAVFEQGAKFAVKIFTNRSLDFRVRHGVACAFKVAINHTAQQALGELADRCGWQGLMAYNQISENAQFFRGNAIAEGDVLMLSIRKTN